MNKKTIVINEFPIKLGQFLKLANIVSDGMEAKVLIASGKIFVNGQPETRRGKKLSAGDKVVADTTVFTCTPSE